MCFTPKNSSERSSVLAGSINSFVLWERIGRPARFDQLPLLGAELLADPRFWQEFSSSNVRFIFTALQPLLRGNRDIQNAAATRLATICATVAAWIAQGSWFVPQIMPRGLLANKDFWVAVPMADLNFHSVLAYHTETEATDIIAAAADAKVTMAQSPS